MVGVGLLVGLRWFTSGFRAWIWAAVAVFFCACVGVCGEGVIGRRMA